MFLNRGAFNNFIRSSFADIGISDEVISMFLDNLNKNIPKTNHDNRISKNDIMEKGKAGLGYVEALFDTFIRYGQCPDEVMTLLYWRIAYKAYHGSEHQDFIPNVEISVGHVVPKNVEVKNEEKKKVIARDPAEYFIELRKRYVTEYLENNKKIDKNESLAERQRKLLLLLAFTFDVSEYYVEAESGRFFD